MSESIFKEQLAVNAVVDAVDAEACGFTGVHRVVTANWVSDQSFLICLAPDKYGRYHKPIRKQLSHLKDCLSNLALVPTPFAIPAAMRKLNPNNVNDQPTIKKLLENANELTREFILDKDEANRNTARIRVIEELLTPGMNEVLLECGQLGTYVARWSAAAKTPRWRVYQLCYRYWVFEQLPSALITDYANCGVIAEGKKRKVTCKLGRHNREVRTEHDPSKEGVNAEPFVDLLHKGYVLFYQGNLAACFKETIRRFFNRGIEVAPDGQINYKMPPWNEVPTYDEFYYWVDKKFDVVKRLFDRTSSNNHQKDMRSLSGTTVDDAPWAGHTYQIDSTTADVWLVSAINRSRLIGRPIVYFVVDTATGCILGLHVTLGTPSWDAAKLALYNAFSDKRDWLAHYGFSLAADEPCFMPKAPIPSYLRADRGETLSAAARVTAKELKFDIQLPGAFRPDLKPDVERLFWTSKSHYAWVPGAVVARQRERGERDYRLDSVLTLYEFTRILIDFVRLYNRHAEKPSKLNEDARAQVPPISPNPLPLWNFSMEYSNATPRYESDDNLVKNFVPSAAATVTSRGIEFMGRVYRPNWDETHFPWGVRARLTGSWRIPICVNSARPTELRCMDPDTGKYMRIFTKKTALDEGHLQFEDLVDESEYGKLLGRMRTLGADQALSDSRSFQEKIVADAKALQAQAQTSANALKADAVRGARAAEQAFNGGANLDELSEDSANSETNAEACETSSSPDSVMSYLLQAAKSYDKL